MNLSDPAFPVPAVLKTPIDEVYNHGESGISALAYAALMCVDAATKMEEDGSWKRTDHGVLNYQEDRVADRAVRLGRKILALSEATAKEKP